MSSLKNDIIYFCLVAFNYISDTYIYYTNKINEIYELYNNQNRGKFIYIENDQSIIPLDYITNIDINNNWIYNSNENKLSYSNSTNKIKIKWLSVELIHKEASEVINLDKFFETFEIYTEQNNTPPILLLLYCIYIYNKKWFSANDTISLNIIDDMGSDYHIDITSIIFLENVLNISSNNELELSLNKEDS
jgi:hypothetical protein